MKTLEVVFGNSLLITMKESKLNSNNILLFNALFNVGDLSDIDNYNIMVPRELRNEEKNYYIKNETETIINNIKEKNKIRVWTGRNDIYSYLIMLYISNIIKKYDYELYAVYSDEYGKDYPSPCMMRSDELEKLSSLEHKLSKEEIDNNANIWNNIVKENKDLRVIENGIIKSVSMDYYDDYILSSLKKMGKVRISQLVAKLMENVYLHDIFFVYFINRLIDKNKIKITLDDKINYFKNMIEIK